MPEPKPVTTNEELNDYDPITGLHKPVTVVNPGQGYGASVTLTVDPKNITQINPGEGARYWDGMRWSCYQPDSKIEVKS